MESKNGWKTHARRPVLEMGKWLSVEDRAVETPDGQVIDHWAWITTPDFINVLAQTAEGSYLIFRQGKYGLAGDSYAPIGGYIEPGEPPLDAARRELLEETGFAAPRWTNLGSFLVDPNRGVATGHFFLAQDARQVAERCADDLEAQELRFLSRAELETALRENRFKVMAWAAAVAIALSRIEPR